MARYLDPKADIVFKKIFADHPPLLISFLNAVLPLPADSSIVEVTYLPAEQVPDIPDFKRTIVDVKCTDARKRVFIVEMQMNWTDSFKERLLFGTSQAFVKQLEKGEDYALLQPVYGLGLVAETYAPDDTIWYHHYQLIKKGSMDGDVIEHLQLVFIELPKFPVHSPEEKKLRLLWLRFLREIDEKTQTVSEDLLNVPEIAQAIELTEEAAYTPAQLESYQSYWDAIRREATLLKGHYAKGLVEGEAKGLAEGEAKGRVEGEAKGRVEGEATGRVIGEAIGEARGRTVEKQAIIQRMLQQGLAVDSIAQITGLTREEIQSLELIDTPVE